MKTFDSNRNLHCSQTEGAFDGISAMFDSNRNLHCSQTRWPRAQHHSGLTLIVIYIALKRASSRLPRALRLTLIVIYIALKPMQKELRDLESLTLIVIYIALKPPVC